MVSDPNTQVTVTPTLIPGSSGTPYEQKQRVFDQDLSSAPIPEDTAMTVEAQKRDQSLGVPLYRVQDIYADPIFNCRGHIAPISVADLARDIAFKGLLQPVIITPRRPDTPEQFAYSLVAGHRRHKSYVVNNYPWIPAVLRMDLTVMDARTLNLIENLKRESLNIMQEANAIRPYHEAGWPRDKISKELGMSQTWVQIRVMLLNMPDEIQEAAASNIFTQQQIRDLYTIKQPETQLLTARKIKEAKERCEDTNTVNSKLRKACRPNSKRARRRPEIFLLQQEIRTALGGNSFTTEALGWAAGELSDIEFYESLQRECAKVNIAYTIPTFDLDDVDIPATVEQE